MRDAQHGFLFFLRTHFTPFCKINKYFIWYRCSLLLLLFSKPSGAALQRVCSWLWLLLRGRGQRRRGLPLPINPTGAALLCLSLCSFPRGGGGGISVTRRWHLCHTGATCPSWRWGCASGVIWVQWHRFISATATCAQNWFKINLNPVLALAVLQQAPAAAQLKIPKPEPFHPSWGLSQRHHRHLSVQSDAGFQSHRVSHGKARDSTGRLEAEETVPGFRLHSERCQHH